MIERLYTEYPRLYDVIQSGYDYNRDIDFLRSILNAHDSTVQLVLEIGCGTGEHTRRLVDAGFEVTAVDKHAGMLTAAREKCDANFIQGALPALHLDGSYELIIAIRGVINHIGPEELRPALSAIEARLETGGLFIFDNSPLPPEGNEVGLDVGTSQYGDYARLAQHVKTGDGQLEWRSVMFGPDGEFFVNSRPMTPFEDGRIRSGLEDLGFSVETHDGFGAGDDRTVFVARK